MNKLFALLLGVVFLTGCELLSPIGAIISIGVMWLDGEGHKYYNADQDIIMEAVQKAAADLDFVVHDVEKKGETIYLKIDDKATLAQKASNSNRFHIKITRIQHNVTKLSIRLNFWGDKPYAELIYKKVDEFPGAKSFKTVQQLNQAVEGK